MGLTPSTLSNPTPVGIPANNHPRQRPDNHSPSPPLTTPPTTSPANATVVQEQPGIFADVIAKALKDA